MALADVIAAGCDAILDEAWVADEWANPSFFIPARLMVSRDERAVIPVGCYHPGHGVTFWLPSVVGRDVVAQVLDPELSEDEKDVLRCSAEASKAAAARIKV